MSNAKWKGTLVLQNTQQQCYKVHFKLSFALLCFFKCTKLISHQWKTFQGTLLYTCYHLISTNNDSFNVMYCSAKKFFTVSAFPTEAFVRESYFTLSTRKGLLSRSRQVFLIWATIVVLKVHAMRCPKHQKYGLWPLWKNGPPPTFVIA